MWFRKKKKERKPYYYKGAKTKEESDYLLSRDRKYYQKLNEKYRRTGRLTFSEDQWIENNSKWLFEDYD